MYFNYILVNEGVTYMKSVEASINSLIMSLPERYRWSLHNLVAHPLSEIVHLIGYTDLGNKIHDCTIPKHKEGDGRG